MLSGDFRSIDGTGNNLFHSTWGSAGVDLLRKSPNDYGDGISTPAGADLPNAREISNVLIAHPVDDVKNDRFMTAFVYAWGQFIDHDMDLTPEASPTEPFNISIPTGDPYFDPNGTGTQIMPFDRSQHDPATGTSVRNPRQQVNVITSWLDGSMIYGSDSTRASALRTHTGGRLLTSDGYTNGTGNLLPLNTLGLPNANDAHLVPDDQLFVSGDIRANENIELTAMTTLFVREHNRLADLIAKKNPWLTDEQIYQQARQYVGAELQVITYNEFIPALLGSNALTAYRGYNPNVNATIANEFSTIAFRIGHSLLGNDVEFLDNNGGEVRDPIALANSFSNPDVIKTTPNTIDPILKYLASDLSEEVDPFIVDGLRNFLFGDPGAGGFDLAARDIQRERDNGMPDYNTLRAAYGLPRVTSFAQITSDVTVQHKLQSLFGDVDHVDAFVGGLAENHVAGSSVGPLFRKIMADQFQRLRDGDRYWYSRIYSGSQLCDLQNTTLADVIRRNSTTTNLQDNVFFFKTQISGRVFYDANRDGKFNNCEFGMGGWTVKLVNTDTNDVMTAVTGSDGTYRFTGMGLGTYRVREILKSGWSQTTRNPADISITRGMIVSNINFGDYIKLPWSASISISSGSATFGATTSTDVADDVLAEA